MDARPDPLTADEILSLLEGFAGREMRADEFELVDRYLPLAWSLEPTLVGDPVHDAARRASLVSWCLARHGTYPGVVAAATWIVIGAWLPDHVVFLDLIGFHDDYVLELLRRADHLDLDVQRDAWGLLYAELYARLRVSEGRRTIPA